MTLVSICIPTYNGADYLNECLISASAQTHRDVEILVVDDCSSDDTVAVAERHSEQDPRIKVSRNARNLGLVGNWNRCIELARGEWVKFLFQDDLLNARCVERLLGEGMKQDRPLVACDRDFLFDESIDADIQKFYAHNRERINSFLAPGRGASAAEYARHIARHLQGNHVGEPTVTLINRRAFAEYGLFCADLPQRCDLEYWARVASQSGIAYVPEALATFRVHSAGTSAVNRTTKLFRADTLDGLLLICMVLDDPVYATFRQHCAEAGLLANLRRKRFDLVNMARTEAAKLGNLPLAEHTVAQEYEQFLARFPQCRVGDLAHLLWRVRIALYWARHPAERPLS